MTEVTKRIDTTAERVAMEARTLPKPPSELEALRVGIADLRDAMAALRSDVAKLTEALAVKSAIDRGFDI